MAALIAVIRALRHHVADSSRLQGRQFFFVYRCFKRTELLLAGHSKPEVIAAIKNVRRTSQQQQEKSALLATL
jgi:hypothetical protein